MDWTAAIDRHGEALKRILAALVAMAGGGTDLSRQRRLAVLRLVRPVEAATRRLVIVMARGLVVTLPPLRLRKPKPAPTILRNGVGTGILMPPHVSTGPADARAPSRRLPLLDPLRSPDAWFSARRRTGSSAVPRISVPGCTPPFPIALRSPLAPEDQAARLDGRLEALASALDDLPVQASRFARWRARRDRALRQGRRCRVWPLRPGRPPGQPPSSRLTEFSREVGAVLAAVHGLAFDALQRHDTS